MSKLCLSLLRGLSCIYSSLINKQHHIEELTDKSIDDRIRMIHLCALNEKFGLTFQLFNIVTINNQVEDISLSTSVYNTDNSSSQTTIIFDYQFLIKIC